MKTRQHPSSFKSKISIPRPCGIRLLRQTFLKCLCCPTYRLELTFLENPGEDEAAQRHCHDEDEGERQGGLGRLHYPQSHDACQLSDGEHVHTPCLHLEQHTRWLMCRTPIEHRPQYRSINKRIEILEYAYKDTLNTLNPKLLPCWKKILHVFGSI